MNLHTPKMSDDIFKNMDLLCIGQNFCKIEVPRESSYLVSMHIDPRAYIVYWTNITNSNVEHCDFATVLDVRYGKYSQPPLSIASLRQMHLIDSFVSRENEADFDLCFMTIVTGFNSFAEDKLTFLTFLAPSAQTAAFWGEALFNFSRKRILGNGSFLTSLEAIYAKLRHGTNTSRIKTSDITKYFAQSKTEVNSVEKALQVAHLPAGTLDSIAPEKLTEIRLFKFYLILTGRKDTEAIFNQLIRRSSGSHDQHKLSAGVHNIQNAASRINRWVARKGSNDFYDETRALNVETFRQFLNNEQRDSRLNTLLFPPVTKQAAQNYIDKYELNTRFAKKGLLTFKGFLRFLLSEDNGPVAESSFQLNSDSMAEPLAHYFINSSHNTYLFGKQYGSLSSVEMYRQVVLTGCRCVELDCWDGRNEEPVVTHGPSIFTRVTEVLFKDCIEAIAESAFKTSNYPVILSFENHCTQKQQDKMAHYCRQIFGDMLLSEPLISYPLEKGVALPPPKALMNKILIKNRKISEAELKDAKDKAMKKWSLTAPRKCSFVNSVDSDDSVISVPALKSYQSLSTEESSPGSWKSSELSVLVDNNLSWNDSKDAPSLSLGIPEEQFESERIDEEGSDSETDEVAELEKKLQFCNKMDTHIIDLIRKEQQRKSKISYSLHLLVNYITAVSGFRTFAYCESRDMSCEVYSFTEDRAMGLMTREPADILDYNKRQLTRVYPKGIRTDSTNYLPQVYWNAGCQMAALNFQTLDLGMQLNLAFFELNGKCGYILKPSCMRRKDSQFHPLKESPLENVVPNSVTVQIISAQFLSALSDKPISSFVEVELYGIAADTVRQNPAYQTKVVRNNGINPIYMDSSCHPFVFDKILLPELAFVRLAVIDEVTRKTLGFRMLPVTTMRPGYRHISLRNSANQPLGLTTLFVRFGVKDYVPPNQEGIVTALSDPIAYQKKSKLLEKAFVNPLGCHEDLKRNESMLKKLMVDPSPAEEQFSIALPNPVVIRDKKRGSNPASPSSSLGRAMGGVISDIKSKLRQKN